MIAGLDRIPRFALLCGSMRKNHPMPSAGHGRPAPYPVRSFDLRLARVERVVNATHKKLDEFPYWDIPRTWDELLKGLVSWMKASPDRLTSIHVTEDHEDGQEEAVT